MDNIINFICNPAIRYILANLLFLLFINILIEVEGVENENIVDNNSIDNN